MPLNSTRRAAVAVLLATLPMACAPPSVYSDRDEAVPIPQGASWAWAAPDSGAHWNPDPALASEITHQRYARAIESAMQAKGFRKAASYDESDFLLTYYMGGPQRGPAGSTGVAMVGLSVGGWGWGRPGHGGYGGYGGYGYGYGWPGWGWGFYGPPMYAVFPVGGSGSVPYGDGVLFILLRERESGYVAWEVRYALDPYETLKVSQGRVQEIVNALFENLH